MKNEKTENNELFPAEEYKQNAGSFAAGAAAAEQEQQKIDNTPQEIPEPQMTKKEQERYNKNIELRSEVCP